MFLGFTKGRDEPLHLPSEKHFWAGIYSCSVDVLIKSKIEEDLSDHWCYGMPTYKLQA